MKSPSQYDNLEEMEECRKKAELEIHKINQKLGFVIFKVVENIRTKGMSPIQRRNHYRIKCRGGSSY